MDIRDVENAFNELGSFKSKEEIERYLEQLKKTFYGDTFGGKRTLEDITTIRYLFRNRRDCDGKCCQCGSCCDRVLQLTEREIRGIRKYLKNNPEVRKKIDSINKGMPHRMCPFLDHTKADKKCLIYGAEFYPANCSGYNCDRKKIDQADLSYKLRGDIPKYVDMWHLIGDPVDISKAWMIKDFLLIDYGLSLAPSIMLYPEKLNDNIKKVFPPEVLSVISTIMQLEDF